MARVQLHDVGVEFAIYNARSRSIRRDLLRRVGGSLNCEERDRVTIQALKNINLRLEAGDRVALMGHNGAGKSTLLRVIAGAYEPSSGTAEIRGKVSSLLDMSMGMDFELTGRQNVILRCAFLGMTFKAARELIPQIAEFSELGPYMDLPMRAYSSGMVLRLAFAVSTSVHADIILLDEMIVVGDSQFAKKANRRLDELLSRAHILVLASQSSQILQQYCNRGLLLQRGQIEREGTIDELLQEQSEPVMSDAG